MKPTDTIEKSSEEPMWEYTVVSSTSGFTVEKLNEMGKERWECVGSAPNFFGSKKVLAGMFGSGSKDLFSDDSDPCILLFKRRLKSP